jgi:hypothetical protein
VRFARSRQLCPDSGDTKATGDSDGRTARIWPWLAAVIRRHRHVRLNVFSDLGGAGVSVVNGVIVKVRKGVGTYDGDELAARSAFQRGFLTTLRQHPDLGAAALYPFLVST